VGVFLGLDVGMSTHHGHGLPAAGKKVVDKPLPNSEPKLRAVFEKPAEKLPSSAWPGNAPRRNDTTCTIRQAGSEDSRTG
jgi:hypothetical protein